MRGLVSLTGWRWCWQQPLASPSSSSAAALTRLAPSTRVPGTTGVFATTLIKKHTPLEIVPTAAAALSSASSSSASSSATTTTPASPVEAPPFVCNLLTAPRRSISLRRFLALRAQFGDKHGYYLHAATPRGWYLLLPASAVPLADPQGLAEWLSRHHHRYLSRRKSASSSLGKAGGRDGAGKPPISPEELRRGKAEALSREAKAWADVRAVAAHGIDGTEEEEDGLSSEELEAIRQDILRETRQHREDDDAAGGVLEETDTYEEEGVADGADTRPEEEGGDSGGNSAAHPHSSSSSSLAFVDPAPPKEGMPPLLKRTPLTIPEAHLFEINDGILWPLPPSDDLADPKYWQQHRQRMSLYEQTGGLSVEDKSEFLRNAAADVAAVPMTRTDSGKAEGGDPSIDGPHHPSEKEVYQQGEAIFHALTRKANVSLEVDDDSGLVTLRPIVDLHPGEELLLHYGREWWTERLLSPLFLNATNAEMQHIRWIEALFTKPTDVFVPFPLLTPAHKVKKKTASKKRKIDNEPSSSPVVLYNSATRKEATDAEVLVSAIRLSCTSSVFLSLLLTGPDAVFPQVDGADRELSLKRVRRALLHALRGYPDDGSYHQPPLPPHSRRRGETREEGSGEGAAEDEEEEDVFKL